MNPYQYSPLQKDRDEFRLVRLLPGPATAEIKIEIFHAARSFTYEALSYAWGPPERTEIAFIREPDIPKEPVKPQSELAGYLKWSTRNEPSKPSETIGITHNLAVALRHLRDERSPRVLWIDALCINQDDLVERSVEVLGMGSIYTHAERVIVWLGPTSKDSGLAITTLRAIGNEMYYHNHLFRYIPDGLVQSLMEDVEALKSKRPNWFAIKDFLRRDWFSRLWVLQEVGLATRATLYVGQHSIDYELFIIALELLWGILAQLNQAIPDLGIVDFRDTGIYGFVMISRKLRGGGHLPLVNSQNITSNMGCSDPRDRLYAIRDLLRPSERELIIPNYSGSIEAAFQDMFLRACLAKGGGNLLTLCLLQDTPSKLQLPSWVPDFLVTNRPNNILNFSASGQSKFYHVATNESLAVQAVKVATITSLFAPLKPSYTNLEIIQVCKHWDMLCSSGAYIGGGSTSDAFVEAILLGERAEMFPQPSTYFISITQCRKVLERCGTDLESGDIDNVEASFMRYVRLGLRSRVLFRTGEGFLGFCPESANHGDIVVVVLGVSSPLVIRPIQHSGRSCYRVVGPCYMPGAMHAERLLGQLPAAWDVNYVQLRGRIIPGFTQGDIITQKDPREQLPPSWRYGYGDFNVSQDTEPSALKDMLPQFYENVETREKTWADPRLTPEALRDRGVDIQELVLV
ncbi:HET-domain-containing protein [Stipitochalara longipes BDJ]|nr:HET-domain-containing protein [Stipitochalara longipes BDJ]